MRIAAYCRVSTEKEEHLSSLENQKEFFEQYATKNGDTLVEIYADEGIRGKSMAKRDAFMRMLADSEKDKFDCVVVKDISRFSRNTQDFLYGVRTLSERVKTKDTCKLCGKQLHPIPGKKKPKFCSKDCRMKWWNSHPDEINRKAVYQFICAGCGKAFTAYGNQSRKYCSHSCYINARFKDGGYSDK